MVVLKSLASEVHYQTYETEVIYTKVYIGSSSSMGRWSVGSDKQAALWVRAKE
jgi:hypothetical protein